MSSLEQHCQNDNALQKPFVALPEPLQDDAQHLAASKSLERDSKTQLTSQ